MSADRGYRDVSSPEVKARIWQEAHEHAARDYRKLLARARNHCRDLRAFNRELSRTRRHQKDHA